MRPIIFGGRFGWLHPGSGTRGVVLCNAYGHESVWSHGGMRNLADRLSDRGMPVLRFDYRGTGDSEGADGASDQFETAVDDVCAAIARLRDETGVTQVTLCGLRLGAAFALAAAGRCDVDQLVLLAPVASGRSYVRELSIMRNIWLEQLPAPLREAQPKDAPFNVLGQVYSPAFRTRLNAFDAVDALKDSAGAPASGTLIVDVNAGGSESLHQRLEGLGGRVERRSFEGYAAFMQETTFSSLPTRVFDAVVDWVAPATVRQAPPPRAVSNAGHDTDLMLRTPEACEQPVRFGMAGLFGILCMPHAMHDRGPVLLITNTSASAHVGDSRLSVRIARELAQRGIASLRFDGRGIGDSSSGRDGGPDDARQPVYSSAVVEDVSTAAHWLKEQGYRHVVSFGICSGAYSALRAALVGRALSGVISVNLQSFHMPDGLSSDALRQHRPNSMAGYRSSFFELQKWKQVLTGKRRIMPFVRLVLKRVTTRAAVAIGGLRRRIAGWSCTETMPVDPHDILRTLQRKEVSTLFVCGAYDTSLDLMTTYFGPRGKRLSRFSGARAVVLDDLDHSVFSSHAADAVVGLCSEFVKGLDARRAPAGRIVKAESPA
ncbi:alpha/beta hydrolase [Burkholderia aenigmatica]|uniref:alpha/beta hydrolase n=1 Tax=Burkholderia aenigmatica TaxID=2015348 RepID=UPI002653CEEA|nr:alpha/beta fold hydrolase [Burkholderia aenigmatica]MDN7874137.1 alpha/beta fold hydrolase [Burkholderia aenigmatica]